MISVSQRGYAPVAYTPHLPPAEDPEVVQAPEPGPGIHSPDEPLPAVPVMPTPPNPYEATPVVPTPEHQSPEHLEPPPPRPDNPTNV